MRVVLIATLIFTISGLARGVVHDGVIDPGFALTPVVIQEGTTRVDCFAALPNGKILVGGTFTNLSGGTTNNIARLNSDGSFDPTFVGRATDKVEAIFPLADGKILISGDFLQYDGVPRRRIARLNSDGSLDPAFAPDFGTDFVQIVALQTDGKMIVNGLFTTVGGVPRNRVARLHPDGTLDLSFVVGGGLTSTANVRGAAVQPDGKIVFVGRFDSYDGVARKSVLRLNTDGSLDTSFVPNITGDLNDFFDMSLAADGTMYIVGDMTGATRVLRLTTLGLIDLTFDTGNADAEGGRIYSVMAQPDGKVIVGGEFDGFLINGGFQSRYCLFRFNSNGSVDASFVGQAGNSVSNGGVRAFAMNGNKILVGGDYPALNGSFRGGIGRLNLDSTLDSSFVGFLGTVSHVDALHVYPDGKILVGGYFHVIGTSTGSYVARLNPNGSVDTSFNVSGITHAVRALAVQPDGKIVVGGYSGSGFSGDLGKGVWRLNPDGSLDATFSAQIAPLEFVRTIAIQPDGKIVIGGDFTQVNGVSRGKLARLNSNGSLDANFTPNVSALWLSTVAVQGDGKILIGGNLTSINGSPISSFARLNADGTTDTGFNIGSGANNLVNAFFVLPDNRIYVGGSFTTIVGVPRTGLVRLKSDGTLDETFKPVRISAGITSIIGVSNNKILAAGTASSTIDAAPRRAIMRFLSDGSLDFSFDVNGSSYHGLSGQVYHVRSQPDGNIIAVGQFDGLNGVYRPGIARLLTFPNPTLPLWDFDGDGRTDISVFRPSTNVWHESRSYLNRYRSFQWGSAGDTPVPADFDGDFLTDIAVFRPSNGAWYCLQSSDNTAAVTAFGTLGDVPVPSDYDGDGRTDLAVFRPSEGNWWLNRSSGGVTAIQFGVTSDTPVPADYDGDRKADLAIFRASVGEWWVQLSTGGLFATQFGNSTDRPARGDYTGDGETDIAIWRPSTGEWFILRSEDFSYYSFPFGINGDIPASGDYDGDAKFDPTVFRPSSATWYSQQTTSGTTIQQFGSMGDTPVPGVLAP